MAITIDVRYNVDTKDLDKANKKLKQTKKATKSLEASANGIKNLAKGFLAVAAAAGTVFVATDRALAKMDKIAKSAKNIGISAEAFQELAYAAELSGVSIDLLEKSLLKLSKASIDAQDGLATQTRAFAAMGISIEQLKGLNPEQLFNRTADGIRNINDPVKKAAAAMAIFGTRGADMITLLNSGAEQIKKFRRQARELGLVLTNDMLASVEKNNDKLNTLKKIIDVQWLQVWADLAPAVLDVSQAFIEFAKQVGIFKTSPVEKFNNSLEKTAELQERLKNLQEGEVGKFAILQELKEEGILRAKLAQQIDEQDAKNSAAALKRAAENKKGRKEQDDFDAAFAAIEVEKEKRDNLLDIRLDLSDKTFQMNKDLETQTRELRIASITDEKEQGLAKLEYEKEQFMQRLDNEGIFGEARLAIIDKFNELQKEKAKAATKEEVDVKKTALEKTIDHFTDFQTRMDETTARSFNKMGDALTDFVMTGKGSFKDMAQAIIADFTRMIIKALIFKAISGMGFATGGVTEGTPAAKGALTSGVERFATGGGIGKRGEQGQEVIMPLRRDSQGRMGIAGQAGGGGKSISLTSNVTVNNPQGDGGDVATQITKEVEQSLRGLIKNEMNEQFRPGNMFNRNIVNVGGI